MLPIDFLCICTFSKLKCKYLFMWSWGPKWTYKLCCSIIQSRWVQIGLFWGQWNLYFSVIHLPVTICCNMLKEEKPYKPRIHTLFFNLWFFHSISQNYLSAFTLPIYWNAFILATVQMTMNCVCWSVHFIHWLFFLLFLYWLFGFYKVFYENILELYILYKKRAVTNIYYR